MEKIFSCPSFDVLKTSKPNRDFYTIDVGDWATIIALTKNDQFVMITQVRAGTNLLHIEAPGGKVDPGETPEITVERELLEETGYRCEKIYSMGFVYPNPALQNNKFHIFYGTGASCISEQNLNIGEHVNVKLFSPEELEDLINENGMHALSLHTIIRGLKEYRKTHIKPIKLPNGLTIPPRVVLADPSRAHLFTMKTVRVESEEPERKDIDKHFYSFFEDILNSKYFSELEQHLAETIKNVESPKILIAALSCFADNDLVLTEKLLDIVKSLLKHHDEKISRYAALALNSGGEVAQNILKNEIKNLPSNRQDSLQKLLDFYNEYVTD